LMMNRTAKKIVQRFRLRSTIEPPPSGPVPLPTPKAPDRPESLPECVSTRNTTITEMITCRTERTGSIRSAYRFDLRAAACRASCERLQRRQERVQAQRKSPDGRLLSRVLSFLSLGRLSVREPAVGLSAACNGLWTRLRILYA